MKSKKALTLALLIVASMLLLPAFIPISPVSAPGSGLPLNPSFIHLEYYTPPYLNVTRALVNPTVGSLWMTIHPMEETGDKFNLTYIVDTNGNNIADPCEQIILRSLVDNSSKWYHVEYVTATLKVENTTVPKPQNPFAPYPLYLEFNGTLSEYLAITNPLNTWWHMIYPQWSLFFNLVSWWDTGCAPGGNLNYSDMVDFNVPSPPNPEPIPNFNLIKWHVDSVKTDLIVSEMEEYPEDPELIHLDLNSTPVTVRPVGVGTNWHEIYPEFCRNYSLTYLVDKDADNYVDACEQIALLDRNAPLGTPAKWYHVEWVTVTIEVRNTTGTIWYLEFGGTYDKFYEIQMVQPQKVLNTFWHRVRPGFSSWFTIVGCTDLGPLGLSVGDIVKFLSKKAVAGDWTVLKLKTNLIVSEEPFYPDSPGFMHLEIIPPIPGEEFVTDPFVCSNWTEIYPRYLGNLYHLFSHIDNNNNNRIDASDLIKLENKTSGEKKWYHVECVTVTIHISGGAGPPKELEFGTNCSIDKFNKIKNAPISTWWHEVWPEFSTWHHVIPPSGNIGYCNFITFEDIGPNWHIDKVLTDLIVSPVPPPTYFWVSPKTNINQDLGKNITVDIMVEDALETQAWGLTLSFNKTVLGVPAKKAVSEGGWLSAKGPIEFIYTDSAQANTTGTLSVGCALRLPFTHGAAGDGKLCSIKFNVKANGFSPLNLANTSLVDMAWVSTEYPNIDGFFRSTGAGTLHDVAITNVVVNPHQVQQGKNVTITVTVTNQGTAASEIVDVWVYADLVVYDPEDPDRLVIGDELKWQIANDQTVTTSISPVLKWNTSDTPGEQWIISANATIVGVADGDPHDNVFIEGNVHVHSFHDLKVVDVKVLTPTVDAYANHKGSDPTTVAKEKEQRTAKITATILNEGILGDNFIVKIIADPNVTKPGDEITLGPKAGGLAAGHSIVVGFEWDINNIRARNGTYVIKANVTLTTPGMVEELKNLQDNFKYAADNLTVVIRDIKIISVSVMTNHPDGWNPITRMNVTVKNVGTVFMRFNIIVFADPKNLSQVVPPYKKSSFPILDGDEVFCGAVSTSLMPGANLSYTGMGLPDGTPGWNRTGTPMLSTVLMGYDEPRYAAGTPIKFPYANYTIVAIVKEDPRYPDKNYDNDYATVVNYKVDPVYDDVAVTYVQRQRRFVYPGDPFYVNVTVWNQGKTTHNVNITVYADENTTAWDGDETRVGFTVVNNLAYNTGATRVITCSSTGLTEGTWYNIYANATIIGSVIPDKDPNDNLRYDLTIQPSRYDIVIISMISNLPQSYLNTAYPTWTPGVLHFNVTVYNNDTVPHIFDVALYWGTTEIGRKGLNLAGKTYAYLKFPFNIPSIPKVFPYPSYPVTAKALVVDARPENNELSNRTLTVYWPGDCGSGAGGLLPPDGKINLLDLALLAQNWFCKVGYTPRVDFNMDYPIGGQSATTGIQLLDLAILAQNWFKGPLGG